ncbi:MAG: ATP phosphoribosyltransferase [Spirochaetales bacterium]|nr:ATP phosphoribosyltransferase [Spirochaetales bacterium]
MTDKPITIALPKGRLLDLVQELFSKKGHPFSFDDRKLVTTDPAGEFEFLAVRNTDLPTYITHGIAGLGICGTDVIFESGYSFYELMTLPFGGTKMCLAAKQGTGLPPEGTKITVATKFTRFTRDYYHSIATPVEIIKLNGSVELGPLLGLADYIVDIVETGSTLKANNLQVLETLGETSVKMIANPAYYKIHYRKINKLVEILKEGM